MAERPSLEWGWCRQVRFRPPRWPRAVGVEMPANKPAAGGMPDNGLVDRLAAMLERVRHLPDNA